MNAKQVIFSLFLVIALVQRIQCGLSHRVLERIALPQLGLHTHNAASSAASAASSAYGSFRNYLTNVYPQLALRPSLVERLNGASASAASAASSSGGSGGLSVPVVPYAAPITEIVAPSELYSPGFVSEIDSSPAYISPGYVSPGYVPSGLESATGAAAAAAAAAAASQAAQNIQGPTFVAY